MNQAAQAPAITSAQSTTFTVGTAGTFTVTATGSPTPTLSETGSLPAGVTFNTSTGVMSGTPASGTAGSYPITFTASNGVSPNATQSFTLTVNQSAQAPAITSAQSTTFTVGTAGTFTVTATGSPTPTLSESGSLPAGVTFSTSTGVLSGTPASGTAGSYSITFTASNGVSPAASQGFTLIVSTTSGGTNNGAAFLGKDTTTQGNWQESYGTDGFAIANSSQVLPTYVAMSAPGTLLYTWAGSTGDTRALQLPDGSTRIASAWYNNPSFTYDFNITDGKTHQTALYAVDWDSTTRAQTVQIVDGDNPSHILDTQNLASYSNGAYLVWNISGHVIVRVTRTAGANAVISGIFFGSASSVAPTITSANNAAFITGSAGTFTVTATGSPTPTLSESGSLPAGVTFNTSTGVMSGTAASGTAGSYPITLTASNGVSPNATQSFTLTVNQSAQAPAITSAQSTTFTVGTAGTFTVTATGSPTPTLSESGSLPAGVTFNTSTGVLSGTPASGTAGSYSITFTASNGVSPAASQGFTLIVSTTSGGTNNGAAFLGKDTTTQGNWQESYGTDGFAIANSSQVLPTYVAMSAPGTLLYTWAGSTGDTRALQLPDGSTRIASAWYNKPGFSYDLNMKDGNAHRVAFYAMDWDSTTRAETITIVDATNPSNILDTESISNFQNGIYLVWTISGHVTVNVTWSAGANAVINGIFFGPPPPPPSPASATFVSSDTLTQGNWQGTYGSDGYSIVNYGQSLPGYAAISPLNSFTYTWNGRTADGRALKFPNSSLGIASAWYNNPTFGLDLALKDGNSHQVALYLLDWDAKSRSETIQIVDANSNAVLSTQNASSFANGTYLVWTISGNVKIIVTATNGPNAVVSGVFFK